MDETFKTKFSDHFQEEPKWKTHNKQSSFFVCIRLKLSNLSTAIQIMYRFIERIFWKSKILSALINGSALFTYTHTQSHISSHICVASLLFLNDFSNDHPFTVCHPCNKKKKTRLIFEFSNKMQGDHTVLWNDLKRFIVVIICLLLVFFFFLMWISLWDTLTWCCVYDMSYFAIHFLFFRKCDTIPMSFDKRRSQTTIVNAYQQFSRCFDLLGVVTYICDDISWTGKYSHLMISNINWHALSI